MKRSELQILLSRLIEEPQNEDLIRQLEKESESDPEALVFLRKIQADFNDLKKSTIPENPFFFSKLKFRMEENRSERTQIQRVRWAVYAATVSLSIFFGFVLGNQVEASSDLTTNVTDEEVVAEQLLVGDYSIEASLLMDIGE